MKTISSLVVAAMLAGCSPEPYQPPSPELVRALASLSPERAAAGVVAPTPTPAIAPVSDFALAAAPIISSLDPDLNPGFARAELQVCFNHEFAYVLMTENMNVSDERGFARGYSRGYDFADRYMKAVWTLPNPEVDTKEIIANAQEPAMRMAKHLTLKQISKQLEKCHTTFKE